MKADYLNLVQESIDRMEQHMGGRLHMDEMAAAAHYSYPQFARVFTDIVGMPPAIYGARRCLTRAAKLLLETDREIADVALDCGYESQQTFTRAFSAEFGMPPNKYRKRGIPDGMTLPFALPKLDVSIPREIVISELPPMHMATFSACGPVLPKDREKQRDRIVGEAWTGLVLWQMAMAYKRVYGREAKLPSVKEQGKFFVERGLHIPPHARYFGYNHPYPCPDTEFGYVALTQVFELSSEEQEYAQMMGISFLTLPGGLYATLPATYGTGSDLKRAWSELHAWLAGNTAYDYGDHPWLEEHLTLPEKGGFHGFRLWMAIQTV